MLSNKTHAYAKMMEIPHPANTKVKTSAELTVMRSSPTVQILACFMDISGNRSLKVTSATPQTAKYGIRCASET